MRILVCAVLLCITAALIFAMHKARGNPGSVFTKSLFRVKGARVLPVISLVYVFYAAVVLFFGLQVVEIASGYERYFYEDNTLLLMSMEKLTQKYDYPLMAIKGRDSIGEKRKPRILVVGDSDVWGSGLSNSNQIWWNMMARELERRGYDCEVFALGRRGASTYDEYLWLRDTSVLEDIQPDLIILGYVTNDPDMSWMDGVTSLDDMLRSYDDRAFDCGWLRALFPGLYDYLKAMFFFMSHDEDGNSYVVWEYMLAGDENLENYYTHVVRPLGEFARAIEIPLLVISTPEDPVASNFEANYQRVLPLFEQAGLPVYNPLALFAGQYSDAKYVDYYHVSPVDSHPGPATSLFLGQYAADVVEQDYATILAKNGNRGGAKHLFNRNQRLDAL